MFVEKYVSPTRSGFKTIKDEDLAGRITWTDSGTVVPLLDPPTSEGNSTSAPPNAVSSTMRMPKMKIIKESSWDDPVREYFEIPLAPILPGDKLAYEFTVALGIYAIVIVRPDDTFEVTRP